MPLHGSFIAALQKGASKKEEGLHCWTARDMEEVGAIVAP